MKLDKEQIDKIYELLDKNYSYKDISEEVGCSAKTVSRYDDLQEERKEDSKNQVTQKLFQEFDKGKKPVEIVKERGYKVELVRKYWKKYQSLSELGREEKDLEEERERGEGKEKLGTNELAKALSSHSMGAKDKNRTPEISVQRDNPSMMDKLIKLRVADGVLNEKKRSMPSMDKIMKFGLALHMARN